MTNKFNLGDMETRPCQKTKQTNHRYYWPIFWHRVRNSIPGSTPLKSLSILSFATSITHAAILIGRVSHWRVVGR
jgi:hypothetical protein